jgi:hypothetical protein
MLKNIIERKISKAKKGNRRFPLKGRYKQSKKRKPSVSIKGKVYAKQKKETVGFH